MYPPVSVEVKPWYGLGTMSDRAGEPGGGEGLAWSIIGTLVAGPTVWGGIGFGIDKLLNSDPVFLPIGLVVGFVASLYLVYMKYGRG